MKNFKLKEVDISKSLFLYVRCKGQINHNHNVFIA